MPDHILVPKDTSVAADLLGDRDGPAPLDTLREKIKEAVDKLLGYGQSNIIVHLAHPHLDTDPDCVALDITIGASNNAKHQEAVSDWLDELEAIVKGLDIYPILCSKGGVSIFLPVGKGFYRKLLD